MEGKPAVARPYSGKAMTSGPWPGRQGSWTGDEARTWQEAVIIFRNHLLKGVNLTMSMDEFLLASSKGTNHSTFVVENCKVVIVRRCTRQTASTVSAKATDKMKRWPSGTK